MYGFGGTCHISWACQKKGRMKRRRKSNRKKKKKKRKRKKAVAAAMMTIRCPVFMI